MEWMLQVVDEVDDAIGALRMFAMAWSADIARRLPSRKILKPEIH